MVEKCPFSCVRWMDYGNLDTMEYGMNVISSIVAFQKLIRCNTMLDVREKEMSSDPKFPYH